MPTNKQKAAFDQIIENPHKPISQVMLEVGYDKNTAIHPKDLTTSKGFIQLLEEHGLDDDSLARRHKQLLNDESNIAIKALDMAYKVKAHYAPEKSVQVQMTGDVKDFQKYQELKEKYEQELLKTIANES
jgi:hypothetical protein